jgi:protein-S-isoprenylcysteine O-methyltransferase Ste14
MSTPAPHTSNSINSTTTHTGPPSGGFNSFNMLGFWFDVEVIAYTIMAVVFLLGLRTWYIPSILFNIFNMLLYFGLFPSHFNITLVLSTTNLIVLGWAGVLVIGLLLLKYDPGSELDRLLVTKRGQKH